MNRLTRSIATGTTAALMLGSASAVAAAEAPPSSGVQYNLADSFGSGLGGDTNPYNPTNMNAYKQETIIPDANECHQLKRNYSALVAQALNNTYIDASCAGATTDNILSKSQWPPSQPPQIDSIHSDATLVTIQVGGNDAGFEKLVEKATLSDLTADSDEYVNATHILENELPDRLDNVYDAVREKAPNATVAVSLYDDILPNTANIFSLCPYFTQSELDLSHEFVSKLNNTVRAAVARAGFTLVESTHWASQYDAVGLPRDACSVSADAAAWSPLRYQEPSLDSTLFGLHPTQKTHEHQAGKVLAAIGAR